MKIIRNPKDMQDHILSMKDASIGFVPTMGYFHEGHLSLMQAARQENDHVITSIFVNPLQFGVNEDLDSYPRDETRDIALAKAQRVDVLFMPSVDTMYPEKPSIQMKVASRVNRLCGQSRPGHFDGVVTILTKLFNIIQPDRAYFGLKDAQQFAVVDGLIQDFNFPIQLIGLPTVRETSGLAKSSRNVYLNDEETKESAQLYQALLTGKQAIQKGENDSSQIEMIVHQYLSEHTSGTIEYVDLLSYPALKSVATVNQQIIIAVAVRFKNARLIDNVILKKDGTLIKRIG